MSTNHTTTHKLPEGATDVNEFITDLDGGQLERKLAIALSRVAANVHDHNKVGEINLKLKLKRVPGTAQVTVEHQIKFAHPTLNGKATEEDTRSTVLHVGKGGRLSLMPESQLSMFDTKPATA